jgi:hypothetical protein
MGVSNQCGVSVVLRDLKNFNGVEVGGPINLNAVFQYLPGTGNGQARWACILRSVAIPHSQSHIYTLTGQVELDRTRMVDVHGDFVAMTAIKSAILVNRSANAAILGMGGSADEAPYMVAVNDYGKAYPAGGWCGFGYGCDEPKILVEQGAGHSLTVKNLDGALAALYDLFVLGV